MRRVSFDEAYEMVLSGALARRNERLASVGEDVFIVLPREARVEEAMTTTINGGCEMGSDDGGAVDVEAAIERRMEGLRPAQDEYVRLSRALSALRPRQRASGDALDVVVVLGEFTGPVGAAELARFMGIDRASAQNKLYYAARTSDRVRRVGRGLYEYVR